MKTNKYLFILIAFCTAFILGCAEDELGPVLGDSSTFTAPVLKNSPTAESKEITAENAAENFEEFKWEKAQYGIDLPVDYVLEMDIDEDFSNPKVLGASTTDNLTIINRRFNDVMLSLGLPSFEESSVYIRVRAVITGYTSDTLYSNAISRSAITFQSSECGNFCTIGLIGSATPGDWSVDTDMRLADPEKVDKSTWTVTLYLIGGEKVKFRADDDWADDWGGTAFPSGTAEHKGDDITVDASGYYKVVFNDETLEYSFTLLTIPTFATIGILGDATAGGWETDIDLTQDADNPYIWTGTVTLNDGEAKFRADDDWVDSWGTISFPSGHALAGGDNIPVNAGTYFVHFNQATGAYAFIREDKSEPFTTIGIIGDATPGGWEEDTDMIQNPTNPYLWSKLITLENGEAKFRADNDWTDGWGSPDFPGGIGSSEPGGPNIRVQEGTYFVTFHTGTGEYYFLK